MVMNTADSPERIIHVMGKMNGAGVESMVMNYYRHIDKEKFQFDFIVDNDSQVIPYEEIKSYGGEIYKVSPYQQLTKYKRDLKRVFDSHNYTIIHSHINSLNLFPLNEAKKAGIPIRIAHSHSTAAAGETTKNMVKNILRPFSTLYPTHYCSCSQSAGEWLFGKKISIKKGLTIVSNGIEIDRFQFNQVERERLRAELNITGKYVIGHTGRLCFQKNQEFLIQLIQELSVIESDAVLLLLGDGPDRQKLASLARKLGVLDKVIFLGNKKDVNRYYNAMDIFVFPSRYEGFGISAIEAQVSGMPVVLSNKVPEEACLTDKCTMLPLEKGVAPWVDTITGYMDDPIRKTKVTLKDFDISSNVKQLEEYYLTRLHESVREL